MSEIIHDLPKEVVIAIIATPIAFLISSLYVSDYDLTEVYTKFIEGKELMTVLPATIIAFFIVLLLSYLVIAYKNRRTIRLIFEIMRLAKTDRRAIEFLISERIRNLGTKVGDLHSENGAILDEEEANRYYLELFQNGKQYDGTDCNLPSVYLDHQKTYLEKHLSFQLKRKYPKSTRILIIDRENLENDYKANPEKVEEFVQKHKDAHIELLYVDESTARKCQEDHHIKSIEAGVWYGNYTLQFMRLSIEEGGIRLFLSKRQSTEYDNCCKFIDELRAKGKPIPPIFNSLRSRVINRTLLETRLAEHWPEFVDYERRMKTESKFLDKIIRDIEKQFGKNKEYVVILDAAAGIGCESIHFAKRGYKVVANEIQEDLRQIMRSNMRIKLSDRHREKIKEQNYNWLQISQRVSYDSKFNVILLMGNSLCLILNESDRKKCLQEFYTLLKGGGIVVIDERNFERIITSFNSINNPRNFYSGHYKAQYIYCGNKVKGWPGSIKDVGNDKIVTFSYGENENKIVGNLPMHAFKKDELKTLLEDVGFVNVRTFSDFSKGYDKDADFFTHVATKQDQY